MAIINRLLIQRILLLLVSLTLITAGCRKTVEDPTAVPPGDRQIKFSLPYAASYDTMYWLTDEQVNIHKFNIDFYSDVDSVIYGFYSYLEKDNNGTIELYNFTDSIPIAGSLINVVSNENKGYYQSGNLKDAFPHKEITLGLRLKGSVTGNYLNAVSGYFYLYRE